MKKKKRMTEHSIQYFLQAFGYPVAGKYPGGRRRSEEILPVQQLEESKKIQEGKGAILHHYYHLQATPYPVSGSYKKKKKRMKNLLDRSIGRAAKEKDIDRVVEDLLDEAKKIY